MIRGIGVDIVKVDRIEQAVERWGYRFLKRIFTAAEIERCQQRARPAQCLALRFAAKEAFAKALGLGMRKGLRWRDIEVVRESVGRVHIVLSGGARQVAGKLRIVRIHVSLSHTRAYAAAHAVAVAREA